MKKLKNILVCCTILMFIFSPIIFQMIFNQNYNNTIDINQNTQKYDVIVEIPSISNQKSNYEIIEEIFGEKLAQYSSQGYFSQIYEASLQATYHALYILDAVGKLDQINQTAITEYLMSHYDYTTGIFADQYSYRYLNPHFQHSYYALTSLLEVNCYALLSLHILDNLDLIDSQTSINFIWSCYNPGSSGFIGQPYDSNLQSPFNISTMDNSFFAIKTLNILMGDWAGYSQERDDLIQFINSLQITNSIDWRFGGFLNDNDSSFNSLNYYDEPLFSSYYCLKSLKIFGMEYSINLNNFNQFLEGLYDSVAHYFRITVFEFNSTNLVATAIGLELSEITGFSTINRNAVINFILNNRNSIGNWDQSTTEQCHELIDIFQIIRCLKESEVINQLTSQEKDQIASSLALYYHYNGYSLLSEDYTSLNLISSVIHSFDLFNRISDLNIQELYNLIDGCYNYFGHFDDLGNVMGFSPSSNNNYYFMGFRSSPIEYYGFPKVVYNHKSTFLALDSLQRMFKLDDFALKCNLMDFINNIIDCQFLDSEFETYGAFLPFPMYTKMSPEFQNGLIFIEYSYYAIKTLELLVEFLNIGNLVDLSFNKAALYGYIARNMHIFNDMNYFNPHDASDPETILQHNYYMLYILKTLNLFDLDRNNITYFVQQHIDYGNIKNIYYCYKIDEILDLEIEFNLDLTSNLIEQLYSESAHEFYESLDRQTINQEIFLWISEMARNNDIYIQCTYKDSVGLGSVNTITAFFSNLIFTEYGQLTSVQFISDQFGVLNLEKQFDNSYQVSFMVPEDPMFYPSVEGSLKIYDHSKLIGEYPIYFQTNLEHRIEYLPTQKSRSTEFLVNVSRKFSSGFQAIHNSTLRIDIFIEKTHIESKNFTREDFSEYSRFYFNYDHPTEANFCFEITLIDDFFPNGLFLFEYDTRNEQEIPINPQNPLEANGMILAIIGVVITVGLVAGVIKVGRWVKIKLDQDEKTPVNKVKTKVTKKDDNNPDNNENQDRYYNDWN